MITDDASIFFGDSGFASPHTINGTANIMAVVGDKFSGRSDIDSAWTELLEISVLKGSITMPTLKQKFTFDSVSYDIDAIKDDGQVVTITLASAKPGEIAREVGTRY